MGKVPTLTEGSMAVSLSTRLGIFIAGKACAPCSIGENVRRAVTGTCRAGLHSLDDEANVIRRPGKPGGRECRACANERRRTA